MVFKLDFRKAFDSVAWPALDKILAIRGFSPTFRSWTQNILHIGKAAILLNGIPGNWIQCKNGLRQGDPVSPYLFLIVTDLLQQLILQNSEPALHHPIFSHLPPTVLQYADDTLMVAAASPATATALKVILNNFAHTTGLAINFSKTTLATLHTDDSKTAAIALAMGCSCASFPQTYLSLPLAPTKPLTNAFNPLVEHSRKLLLGWHAKLLDKGDRLILISTVMDSILTYFMSMFCIPKKTIKTFDSLRRDFFGQETMLAQVLNVWKNVCLPKKFGGLGLKNLQV
uniref:Reverse transcriptase domain-containing protein n=1 Tax=Aegilops tauschii subsp. strangulata TaxID=200361 RepID=A0A453NKF2_AEGTS